jgi:hypothetical protein
MILTLLAILGLLIVAAAYEHILAAESQVDFDTHTEQALALGDME